MYLKIILLLFIIFNNSHSQFKDFKFDKCGYNSNLDKSYLQILGNNWGYSYDSLLIDLEKWSTNPYIKIDSLGSSVQNRALWQLSITSSNLAKGNKSTVFIHARTHPGEIQSWRVTEQIISQLTSESELAQLLRQNCIFYIIPMYNPDGVELELPRENANGIDLESNWDSTPAQPEVAVLRGRFTELMTSSAPIKIAMNMHSAYGKHRFFVYHDSVGTSSAFTYLEQDYIGGVRFYYEDGIEPWYYRVTWTTGTPAYYPESWFWVNYKETVMALTYEDWNNPEAFNFDRTANAILSGIAEYLEISITSIVNESPIDKQFTLLQNYPNPFNVTTNIQFELDKSERVKVTVYNIQGKQIAEILNEEKSIG